MPPAGLVFRACAACAAWGVGRIVGTIAMVLCCYDGFISLIFQPIMVAILSAICVGIAYLVGLVFRFPILGRLWSWRLAAFLIAVSIATMLLGSTLGLTTIYTDPESQQPFTGLHPAAALLSYGLLIFSIANWPMPQWLQRQDSQHQP